MTAQRAFVFVESNSTGTGPTFIARARDRGLHPFLLARDPQRYRGALGAQLSVVPVETTDAPALAGAVGGLQRQYRVAGMYSSSEYFVAAVAQLARHLRMPGEAPEAVARCRHKPTQRAVLAAAGIAVPRSALARSADEACAVASALAFPLVVKPPAGSGSVGVRLCRTTEELRSHAAALCAAAVNERGLPVAPEVLVEEYVLGAEYSVETFGTTVIGITRKLLTPEPYFVELGHDFPCPLPRDGRAVRDTVRRALHAVGLRWGPAHTEVRLAAQGPVVIEINPRLAGGYIPELVRLATGVDLVDAAVALACGERVSLAPRWQRRASIRFLTAAASGTVESVDGADDARAQAGVADVRVYRQPPYEYTVSHDFRDRLGHVIVAGGRAADVPAAAQRALQCLSVRMAAITPAD